MIQTRAGSCKLSYLIEGTATATVAIPPALDCFLVTPAGRLRRCAERMTCGGF